MPLNSIKQCGVAKTMILTIARGVRSVLQKTATALFAVLLYGSLFVSSSYSQTADPYNGVGITPFRPSNTHLRLFLGFTANIGLINDAPIGSTMELSYQFGHHVITAGFISGNSTSFGPPRKSWFEGDVMYGIAFSGNDVGIYGPAADRVYMSASAGLGIYSYQERWRFGRRFFNQPPDTTTFPPNTSLSGIGVPIVLQGNYLINSFAGIGLMLYTNLNTQRINYGAAATVEADLGRLWNIVQQIL